MKLLPLISLVTVLAASGFVYSCASSESTFDGSSGSGTGSSSGSGNGSGSTNGNGGTTGISVNNGGTTTIGSEDTCGANEVAAELTPIYMVFVFDKSASMGVNGTTYDETANRWTPVKNGVEDFFTNAGTKNVQASMVFFAHPGTAEATCAYDYSVPDVPMTPLETPAALITALDDTVPSGGTPTLPAIVGGIKYAKKLLTDNPGSQAIVVLVTDGEPAVLASDGSDYNPLCAPADVTLTNTPDGIATYVNNAKLGTPSVTTHVIGIGNGITTLKTKLEAIGTDFILVDVSDPTATRTAIVNQLTAIQPARIDCRIALSTTVGEFDPLKVNVNFVHGDSTVDALSRSDDCPGVGWRYDDETAPKYIELCPTSCTAIQSDLEGKLKVVLGCPTRVMQ